MFFVPPAARILPAARIPESLAGPGRQAEHDGVPRQQPR
ncbi:hypothetical protein FsymDg_0211 [Candidatus Protofrankia datiscae]|uniref:Uncharacterized protein n=1 Tax=Candidatus Protofrankia datiscae TaxID=2716812 RepID=F8B2R2_9ACTN|nr:hypothetical protein FsymDg_0211 [Candidatus Protofrankia datiscae]